MIEAPKEAQVAPQLDAVCQIGMVHPSLVELTPLSDGRILDGYYLAFKNRRVQVGDGRWEITEVFFDPSNRSKVMARFRPVELTA